MPSNKINIDKISAAAQSIARSYYGSDPEPWFSFLCPESICISAGTPMLFGQAAIKMHFADKRRFSSPIIQEEYFPVKLSDTAAQVCGSVTMWLSSQDYKIVAHFSMIFKLIVGEIKLIHQHHSHEYIHPSASDNSDGLQMDVGAFEFVRQILIDENKSENRITLKSKKQSIIVNANSIVYIQGNRKTTKVVCLDRIISCNSSIGELESMLPEQFYRMHRGYIVNKQYIISVRRFEAELISGITLPIPSANYQKVKQVLLSS